MEELKIGYKIVKKSGKELVSLVRTAGYGRVIYSIKNWTFPLPGCGPLAAFSSLEAAEDFWLYIGCTHPINFIYKAEYVESSLSYLLCYNKGFNYKLINVPARTVFASRLKLLRCVSDSWKARKS